MKIRLADFIADFLVDNNIRDLFTVTGGGAMHLNDAFGRKQGLRCVYNHHEQACAIAAEGFTRTNNQLCAVCVTTGPGGTNALTGVLGSWLDSIPMLIISGQVKFSTTIKSTAVPLRQLGDQEFNITDCAATMTKYARMIDDPLTILYHLKKALFLATHGRPGPVWLDIPLNVQAAVVDTDELIDYCESEDGDQLGRPVVKDQTDELLRRLQSAARPVILAGEGIIIAGVREEFRSLAAKFRIPVVTAWNAHDLTEDYNEFYCGRPGTVGTRGGNFVLQNADFVLSLGCRMNIRQISYNYENFAKNAYLAAIDIDRGELDKPTLRVDLKICADLRDALPVLLAAPYEINPLHADWLGWAKRVNEKYPAVLPVYYAKDTPVNPYVFIREMSACLDGDDVVVCGNGSACVCTFQAIQIKKGQRVFTNSGCASMGYGLPAAIGAAVYRRGSRVICLDGDGSLMMNLQELQTVAGYGLNLKLFLLNNDGYHSIRQTQTNTFNSHFCGVDKESGISFPSFEKVAAAFGLRYEKIASVREIKETVGRVLSGEGGVLCEVFLDKEQFFAPKLSSKTLPDGTIVSPTLEDMYPFLPADEMKNNMIS